MITQTTPIVTGSTKRIERASIPEDLRPARGLFVGLALSAIIWLSVAVAWLAL
ncbi:hypothetical protein [Aureimonas sp. AU22]|uniref:hypothetical protein n=1 Tax=Aureimonas sp. AU22 TaxID=1638162 RepID=UPI000AE8E047|nr:hypothetical protein [Aureimonas sp. AU22]